MKDEAQKQAVIYCRVSDPKQVLEGTGLDTQETRCREFAAARRHSVLRVFRDDITGSVRDRDGMNAMLALLRKNRDTGLVVIIDDVSRLGRDREVYWALRKAIRLTGAVMESPSIRFGEDADSLFFESVMIDVAAHQRLRNAEQTKKPDARPRHERLLAVSCARRL